MVSLLINIIGSKFDTKSYTFSALMYRSELVAKHDIDSICYNMSSHRNFIIFDINSEYFI